MTTEVAGSKITQEQKVKRKIVSGFNVKTNSIGSVLTSNNPAEERRLTRQLTLIENERKRRENVLTWNQRNFFISQVFDQDDELRFPKAEERPSYLSEELPESNGDTHKKQGEETSHPSEKEESPDSEKTKSRFPKIKLRALGIFASGSKRQGETDQSSLGKVKPLTRSLTNVTGMKARRGKEGDAHESPIRREKTEVNMRDEKTGATAEVGADDAIRHTQELTTRGAKTKTRDTQPVETGSKRQSYRKETYSDRNDEQPAESESNTKYSAVVESKNPATFMTIPPADMSGRRHNSSVQKSFQSTEGEKNKTSEDTMLYEGKERERSRSNIAINKDGRFLPEILREGTILDMQALLQEESARGTAEATVGKRRKTRKKKKDKKSKKLHKGVGEHRSEVTENDEQFEVELTEEEKERDKLFRRITRTLPTHLLLKAHERENQAGADMSAATKKQQLLQRMKDSSSSGEVLKDPRFTNILRALSHNKL